MVDTPLDKMHYKLKDLLNIVLPGEYHINRLKHAQAITPSGIVDTHQEYLDTIKKGVDESQLTKAIDFHQDDVPKANNSFLIHLDCMISTIEKAFAEL